MHDLPLECVEAFHIWVSGSAQLAHGGNEEVGRGAIDLRDLSFSTSKPLDIDLPFIGSFVPASLFHLGIESDVLVQTPFVCYSYNVLPDLFLARIFTAPVRIWFE